MKRDYYSLDEIEKEIFKGVKDEQEGKVIQKNQKQILKK